jgi:hypothetical protein
VAGVAVVNEAFARVYFGGANPVGRRLVVDSSQAPMEIVGIATDAVYYSVREASLPAVYVPLEAREGATMLLRTSDSGADLPRALRRELARLAPDVQLREAVTFESFLTQQFIRERTHRPNATPPVRPMIAPALIAPSNRAVRRRTMCAGRAPRTIRRPISRRSRVTAWFRTP